MTMRGILGIVMMLISMHVFAGIANDGTQDEEPVNVKLDKGHSSNKDTHPRTLIPIVCTYANGGVQLVLLEDLGEYTLTVTNQQTGECWSAINALALLTSKANGIYWVEIETGDGTLYYGTYIL